MYQYTLNDQLHIVKGVGQTLSKRLESHHLRTIGDLLLYLPLRYEDRTHNITISEVHQLTDETNPKLVTIKAVVEASSQFRRGRTSRQSATVSDDTGTIKLSWFNSPYVIDQLRVGEEYFFSGKYNTKYRSLNQPKIEKAQGETIHTNRLVPVYSSSLGIKDGSLRRLLKHVVDNLKPLVDPVSKFVTESEFTVLDSNSGQELTDQQPGGLKWIFQQLHFPDSDEHIIKARERIALEELLSLMRYSQQIKQVWQALNTARAITISNPQNRAGGTADPTYPWMPATLPFSLTQAQIRTTSEILEDLQKDTPMNRLLIGDVGAGKTVIAAITAQQILLNGGHSCLVAPTRILAEQHAKTITSLLPNLPLQLITGDKSSVLTQNSRGQNAQPTLFVGTHAILNRLDLIHPDLLIYDEQHRFGVHQRSVNPGKKTPHTLTMSATPIPRSLMLTLFSHLQVSYLDELPPGRIPVKTWILPESKREGALSWIADQISENRVKPNENRENQFQQVLVVCPFIDPSAHEALENVTAATATFENLQQVFAQQADIRLDLLHSRVPKRQQQQILTDLYDQEIDILVTTPMVEVGVDLPQASIMVIENAERFGLASLHQLRGRVGRAGQQGYCLLFTTSKSQPTRERLRVFSEETNGIRLAEYDLQNRGSGDLFGTQQSGFSQLKYGSWTDLHLIAKAKELFENLPQDWQSFIQMNDAPDISDQHILAN